MARKPAVGTKMRASRDSDQGPGTYITAQGDLK